MVKKLGGKNMENASFKDYSKKIAIYALEKTKQVKNERESVFSDFNTLSKKIPSYIQFNGLAPTIAFLISKLKKPDKENNSESETPFKEEEHYLALKFMFLWLTEESMYKSNFQGQKNNESQIGSEKECSNFGSECIIQFVENILSLDSETYRIVSSELIKLYQWFARFTTLGSK